MNILNGNEAFAALMAGKNIMCRAVGELIEFDDLDQFPATVFAMQNYEFCIKIELIELAGITFTTPLTIDEIQEGQDVFSITTHCPGIYISEFGRMTTTALIHSINSGFVQRDEKNAKLQLKAMCKAFGRELDGDCLVVRLGEQTKTEKKRQSRKKIESEPIQTESVKPTGAESTDEPWQDIETDPVKLLDKFTAEIAACTSTNSALALRPGFLANGHLKQEQHQYLCKLVEEKLLELDPEQYTPKVESEPKQSIIITDQTNVTASEDSLIEFKKPMNQFAIEIEAEITHESQKLLDDLLLDVSKAQTPTETNALIRYTKSWKPELRQQVIDAIHKRLVQLNPPAADDSLAVRIQRAEDLTELDAFEIDVSACDAMIQPKLMKIIEKRRLELDPFALPERNL